ncbi:hypothetical protein CJU89_2583 [Yarrowia sp. B02]|nr:hypothetical protein CJU89_2583 [Yarrowia sp. B02]
MSEVAELRMEMERELELLRAEVDELKQQLIQQDAERHEAQKNQGETNITKENVTAAGVLSILLLLGSMGPGWYMAFGVMFSEGDGTGLGLVLVNMFLPVLILVVTWVLPLMDRDRLILEAVMLLGYGSFMIYEMTKSLWSPLAQILMVGAAIFLRHLHQNELYRRKQGLPVSVDLGSEV